jgi:hypothetical protein
MQNWKIYRTKYLVKAKQLSRKYSVIDSTGRVLTAQPGDYLVENSDGSLRIARREVFEDVYAELETENTSDGGLSVAANWI